ncbi:FAD-dependent oxidoreductase [Streptomyces hydrogenans]|uniref:FAD-dependent oxidoreductase n=1 Tax=Streptomyces hydrogenans TaxID=1873719 RepID=UPI003691BCA2
MRTAGLASFAPLSEAAEADVAVIGSGIVGLSTAWELARAGLSALVLEAGGLAGGVTCHTTGKLTALHTAVYDSQWRCASRAGRQFADKLWLPRRGGLCSEKRLAPSATLLQ